MTWMMLWLAACADPDSGKPGDDTSGGDDSDSGEPCTATVSSVVPAADTVDVYYRDTLEVAFTDHAGSAVFTLADTDGDEVATDATWSEGNLKATLTARMAASTTYTLTVDVCGSTSSSDFTTSSLGTPLSLAPEDLAGRTYMFRLSDANITTPSILESFDDAYLTAPLLFEVEAADATSITFLGAPGVTVGEDVVQDTTMETWPFPAGDFSDAPSFRTATEGIIITYLDTDIALYDFAFDGTFTADGTSIQQARATALADTREMGPLLNQGDDPDAVCAFAETFGVYCEPCPDEQEYCLHIEGESITANWLEGIDVLPL